MTVCNAGIMSWGSLLDQNPEDWKKMSAVNVVAASYCAQLSQVPMHLFKAFIENYLLHILCRL